MGGNKLSLPADKRILIIGGGYGGSTLGSKLLKENHPNFTVVDVREAMHHNIATGRASVQKGFVWKTLIPFRPTFADHFKQGRVSDIKAADHRVVLQSGEELPYDVLVIATGTRGPFPVKLEGESMQESAAKYDEMADKIKNAQRITVIGGGAAGVEFASEIKSDYPGKDVTLIHSSKKIIDYPLVTDNFREQVMGIVDRIQVKVILGERVENLNSLSEAGPGQVVTSGGKQLDSDLVLKCTGLKINNGAYVNSGLARVMEANGALKVNSFLQVEGEEDVYAIGDCNNTPENKLAMSAMGQADVVLDNLKKKYNNQELTPYKPGSVGIALMLGLGRDSGLAMFSSGKVLYETIAKRMKAKGMMVDMVWKTFNQKPPE